MAELRFNVFGKLIAVAPTATGWQAYLLDQDGKRSPMDIVVPAFIGTAIDQAITWDDYGPDPEEFDHVPGVDQMSTRIDERLKLAIVTAAVRMLSTSAANRLRTAIEAVNFERSANSGNRLLGVHCATARAVQLAALAAAPIRSGRLSASGQKLKTLARDEFQRLHANLNAR
jgi:hypothetical protein